jgi:hypothetical protein
MKAIETNYDGYRFRSRLEAKWAHFFNLAGVRYDYEIEGFVVNGKPYLPDFYLPNTYLRGKETKGVFVEIKHEGGEFIHYDFNQPLVVFFGEPMLNIWGNNTDKGGEQIYPHWDNEMLFWKCNKCEATKIEFREGNYNDCPLCLAGKCNELILNKIATEVRRVRF